MNPDVLLVNSPSLSENRWWEHLGLGYLAAVLRQNGFSVQILDAALEKYSIPETVEILSQIRCSVLGISVFRYTYEETREILCKLKPHIGAHIVVGGFLPTFWHDRVLREIPQVDSVCIGEGETTLLELTRNVLNNDWKKTKGIAFRENGETIVNPPRPLIEDISALPFPSRDTLPLILTSSYPSILSSRGCRGQCSFCEIRAFYSQSPGDIRRLRTADNILDEIETLIETWNTFTFFFVDDDFIGLTKEERERAWDIADKIVESGLNIKFAMQCRADEFDLELFSRLKEAGLTEVYLGIESGVQNALNRYNKNTTVEQNREAISILEKLNLGVQMGFIMFDPDTTVAEVKENLKFFKDIGYVLDDPSLRLEARKGTKIERKLQSEGIAVLNGFKYDYEMGDDVANRVYSFLKGWIAWNNLSKSVRELSVLRTRCGTLMKEEPSNEVHLKKVGARIMMMEKGVASVRMSLFDQLVKCMDENGSLDSLRKTASEQSQIVNDEVTKIRQALEDLA